MTQFSETVTDVIEMWHPVCKYRSAGEGCAFETDMKLIVDEAFADGIERAVDRVTSFWRPSDTLADIVSHIHGEHP